MEIWMFIILILSSFVAVLISGAAGFGGALLLLPVATACVGAEIAVPVLTVAQLIGNTRGRFSCVKVNGMVESGKRRVKQ